MISDKEHKKLLKQFHKLSDRHILAVETDMPYSDALRVVALSDKIRKAGNATLPAVLSMCGRTRCWPLSLPTALPYSSDLRTKAGWYLY